MEKKRILSLLLSILILATLVLPIGAFAEEEVQEPVNEELITEEPVYEETAYEESVYEEPLYEEPVNGESVYEELVNDVPEEAQNVEENAEDVFASAVDFAIVSQPEREIEAEVGDQISLHVVASGNGLSYQWKYSNNKGSKWYNCTANGYDTDTFAFAMTSKMDGRYYKCAVTNADGQTLETSITELKLPTEFVYADIDNTTVRLVKYNGTDAIVEVPQTYNGKTVVEIGEEAFMNNTTLTSIDLPDTITVIRARAFKGCTSLSSMK